jgi:hypothetical protein
MKYMIQNGKATRRVTLPIVNCEGGGACCRHMGTPPGYAMFYPKNGVISDEVKAWPDYQR